MVTPFGRFIQYALKDFAQHLENERKTERTIDQRMRGARQFAMFLLGRPHRRGQQIKSLI